MRAVVQRVLRARVEVDGEVTGAIERGLCVFVGAGKGDTDADLNHVLHKVLSLRVFPDEALGEGHQVRSAGKMKLALADVGGGLLIVSQFTLFGDVRRGNRPSFDDAMPPAEAEVLYDRFVVGARAGLGPDRVATGRFRADMKVHVENDGPVTILIDSRIAPRA